MGTKKILGLDNMWAVLPSNSGEFFPTISWDDRDVPREVVLPLHQITTEITFVDDLATQPTKKKRCTGLQRSKSIKRGLCLLGEDVASQTSLCESLSQTSFIHSMNSMAMPEDYEASFSKTIHKQRALD